MIDTELLSILCCPETHQTLGPASPECVERVNAAVSRGTLKNRGGQVVTEVIDGGLVRADGKVLYPVRQGIPVMLVDEGLGLPL